MNETLKSWLDEKIEGCAARERALRAEDRADEATLERIAGNVYDIARTVLGVAARQHVDDPAAARAFFQTRLERLNEEWSAARDKALSHGDDARAHTENVKLAALAEVLGTAGSAVDEVA